MKKLLLSIICIANMFAANAQAIAGDYLNINNIKARVNAAGDLFSDFTFTGTQFEVPKGSGKGTIYGSNLWFGGYDAGGQLHIAGQTYRQTGTDFFAGPIDTAGTYGTAYDAAWNRVWKINKCAIDTYSNWISAAAPIGSNPLLSGSTEDTVSMEAILNWPAFNMNGQPLAPFVDANSDGVYDPAAGDVPLIKGDQAIFFVYNDARGLHTETNGAHLGLEIQGMVYAYSRPNDSALYNTVFTSYKIINKTASRLDSVFIGNWTDFDIGYYNDDYVGCDVSRAAYYGYNGTAVDGSGQTEAYGANPPAQAVVFLRGPLADANGIDDLLSSTPNGTNYGDGIIDNERLGMSKFLFYNNAASLNGNPQTADNYYQYVSETWKNGSPVTYGGSGTMGSVHCNYMFPGASDPLGYGTNMNPQASWDEASAAITPGDIRGIGASGPFTLRPNSVQSFDFAYVYGRAASGGNLASVAVMKNRIDSVRHKFNIGITGCSCSTNTTGVSAVPQKTNSDLFIHPNPAKDNIYIDYTSASKNAVVEIYNVIGEKLIQTKLNLISQQVISIADLAKGLYILKVQDGEVAITKKFLKE